MEIERVVVRRVLLQRTKHYLGYWINTATAVLEVISSWGTPLEDEPQLRIEGSSDA